MSLMSLSNENQLNQLRKLLESYWLLPELVRGSHITGGYLERVLAHVRCGRATGTYDFADVVEESSGVGWQVKSTRANTPVTWKRAKISNKEHLIRVSEQGTGNGREEGLKELGNSIIEFCNEHIRKSLEKYSLNRINYARLIHFPDNRITYFERPLVNSQQPNLFNPDDFKWEWRQIEEDSKDDDINVPLKGRRSRKNVNYALYGIHKTTNQKWWAWHGKSENQLHFLGEKQWWPKPEEKFPHPCFTMELPSSTDVLTVEKFLELISKSNPSS